MQRDCTILEFIQLAKLTRARLPARRLSDGYVEKFDQCVLTCDNYLTDIHKLITYRASFSEEEEGNFEHYKYRMSVDCFGVCTSLLHLLWDEESGDEDEGAFAPGTGTS